MAMQHLVDAKHWIIVPPREVVNINIDTNTIESKFSSQMMSNILQVYTNIHVQQFWVQSQTFFVFGKQPSASDGAKTK